MVTGHEPAALLGAYVGPRAAKIILRHCRTQIDDAAGRLDLHVAAESRQAAKELRAAVRMMAAAAAQLEAAAASSRVDVQEVAASESPKVSLDVEPAGSAARRSSSSSSVVEVARRLGVSEQYVRELCRDRRLRATRAGRAWEIDAASVEDHIDERRSHGLETPPRGGGRR